MNENEVIEEFDKTYAELLEKIAAFSDEDFNSKPAPEKWSAGQVSQHLIKANSGFPKMVAGESEAAARKVDEKIEQIKGDFMNFDQRTKAADFLVPEEKKYEKEAQIDALENIKADIEKIVGESDLSRVSTGFEFPVYGYLTRLETLAFIVYHTQRHIHQLDEISSQIK